jgi:DNA polymerase-3 subunit gamma/tau
MSYQVLARKWRPTDFSEVVGQEHVVKALSNALDQNKIHQAYVLSGTRGVGKTTIARILSKSLNCEEGLDSKPCHKCGTCISIAEGSFMDFQEIDAASSRGVDDTKQLLETVMYMPSSSRYKVYLLDEVHMLSPQSFNMLLKTLEEPPEHVIFILATTLPEKIPATVLSRCLQFNLKNLTPSQLSDRIRVILKEEDIDFDEGSVLQIARAGRGSLRDCLTITDQAIAYCNGKLTDESISEMLGTLTFDHVIHLMELIINQDAKSLLNKLEEIAQLSIDYMRLMDLILETAQHIAIAQISTESLSDLDSKKEDIISLSSKLSQDDIQILYQVGLLAKRDMDLAPDIASGFEMALLRMLAFLPESTQSELPKKKLKQPESDKEDLASVGGETKQEFVEEDGGEEAEEAEAEAEAEEEEEEEEGLIQLADLNQSEVVNPIPVEVEVKQELVDEENSESEEKNHSSDSIASSNLNTTNSALLDDLTSKNWNKVFQSLDLDLGTKQLASHCSFLRVDNSIIYLAMPEEKLDIFNGSYRQKLQDSVSSYTKTECNLFFEAREVSEGSPNSLKNIERDRIQNEAKDAIKDDPDVKILMDTLGAKIIDSTIEPREVNE